MVSVMIPAAKLARMQDKEAALAAEVERLRAANAEVVAALAGIDDMGENGIRSFAHAESCVAAVKAALAKHGPAAGGEGE